MESKNGALIEGTKDVSEPLDRQTLHEILTAVLKAHDIDPASTGPVPFEKMASIARHVRLELERTGVTDDQLHDCLDWLIPEILDRSMTEASQRMAIAELGKGLGFNISRPS